MVTYSLKQHRMVCILILFFTGIPKYRTHVLYVPQRPSILPGTPRDFLYTVASFHAQGSHKSASDDPKKNRHPLMSTRPIELSQAWGVEERLWDRNWTELSGGEAQRIALAVAVGMETAEVILLDGWFLPSTPYVFSGFEVFDRTNVCARCRNV